MDRKSERPSDYEIERVVKLYGDMLYKICYLQLCNKADAEDAVQETLFRYISKSPLFNDTSHEKAWLITVAINISKNIRRFNFIHNYTDIDELFDLSEESDDRELLEAVMSLPSEYKMALHLFYYEGYKTEEISEMLNISQTAVLKRLQRGRQKLRTILEG